MIPEKTFKAEEKQMRKGKSRLPVVRGACSSWVLAATAHNARRLPRPRKGGTITSCRISTPLVVAVRTVPSYPSIGLGREAEGGLVLAGEECQGARRGLVERGGGDT